MVLSQDARALCTAHTGLGGEPEAVRILLLGRFQVSVGTEWLIGENDWRLRKAAGLVKLLALAPNHRMHRERMMDLLWPKLDVSKAANNLRYTLHNARRTLEPSLEITSRYLQCQGQELVLCSEGQLWVDVEAFEEAAAEARHIREPAAYRTAIELYTGELLPVDLYEEWAEGRRERLRQAYLSLLVELSRLYEERKEYGTALEALRRAVEEEPTYEEARAGLRRLQAVLGRPGEAMGQYERPEEVLSWQLASEPSVAGRHPCERFSTGRFSQTHPLPAGLPPEVPLDARRHNLPVPRSSLVGREKELVEVKRLLSTTRLLTLTGTGGSGKTRLALAVAGEMVGIYPDGVWLVELATLAQSDLVPKAVAEALGVREQPDRPLIKTLIEALREKEILLVLDNCEHLVDAVARLTYELLGTCPGLEILATSREALRVAGEAKWPVLPLSLPESERPLAVEELEGCESARLLVERARYQDPAFALTKGNARAVAEICKRLDGIPLAIELATARVGVLTVEQISERLEDTLMLLTAGGRTVAPRHQTLRGALDWSYELLSEMERKLFFRLCVFAGGWTLEATEAVGAGNGVEKEDVLNLLGRLVDKSLVVMEAGEGAPRYKMLEPVRQYGRERLRESGEADAVASRHARFFLALAEEVDKESGRPGYARWLRRLETEHDNMRAALGWSLGGGEAELGLRLAGTLWLFWFTRGHALEGRGWLKKGISQGHSPAAKAKALNGAGWMAMFQDDLETAKTLLEESLALYRGLKDEEGIASSLNYLGYLALLGPQEDISVADLLEEALAIRPRLKYRRAIANTLIFAALEALLLRGDPDKAIVLQEEALALLRKTEDRWGISMCLINLGLIVAAIGHHDRATTLLEELMHLSRELDYKFGSQYSFFGLACVADSEGHTARAARLWAVSEAIREDTGLQLPSSMLSVMGYENRLARLRARLGEPRFERAWAEGKSMVQKQAVEYALSKEEPATPTSPVSKETLADKPLVKLTRREEEVAVLITEGLTNRQIAERLVMSKRTVDNHVSNILKKLGLRSREQVVSPQHH